MKLGSMHLNFNSNFNIFTRQRKIELCRTMPLPDLFYCDATEPQPPICLWWEHRVTLGWSFGVWDQATFCWVFESGHIWIESVPRSSSYPHFLLFYVVCNCSKAHVAYIVLLTVWPPSNSLSETKFHQLPSTINSVKFVPMALVAYQQQFLTIYWHMVLVLTVKYTEHYFIMTTVSKSVSKRDKIQNI